MPERVEISGDGRLSPGERVRYLLRNLRRNLGWAAPLGSAPRFTAPRDPATPGTASPGRALTEAWIRQRLPRLLDASRPVRILEIGCGSGRMARLLSELGYHGSYHGVDIDGRFDLAPVPGMETRFTQTDIHAFDPGVERYDLILSVSALEHIPRDEVLLDKLPGWLAQGGLEVHVVPGGWGLPVYLWHGFRQYPLFRIAKVFRGREEAVEPLGGLFSFLLHFLFITLGELLLPLKLRKRSGGIYNGLLDLALKLDQFLPWTPVMHVMRRRGPTGAGS